MSSYGCVLVGRNDNYGGNLIERASYSLNSCIESYDQVIYVDWNSRGVPLHFALKDNLIQSGKLRCITVTPEEHKKITGHYIGAQPCSEVMGRNVGVRRLSTDFIVSTNVDEINPPRRFLESFTSTTTMVSVARRGTTLHHVAGLGGYRDISSIREQMLLKEYQQSWAVTREPYSLVEWCGDLQLGHRDVWYSIKGYEESQLGVGVHDSFINRKAVESGFSIEASYSIPIWHLDHHKSSDYNESSVGVDTACLYGGYPGSTNTDNWGVADYTFEECVI